MVNFERTTRDEGEPLFGIGPTGGKDEWLTPPAIINALGPFDLPDFNRLPNCMIEVSASWTHLQEMPFRADTVLGCLRLAVRAKDAVAKRER